MARKLAIIYKGDIMETGMISLKKGNKIIKRNKDDYESNKNVWEYRGWSLAEDKPEKPKKKKSKK